jgi:hypothetical protein
LYIRYKNSSLDADEDVDETILKISREHRGLIDTSPWGGTELRARKPHISMLLTFVDRFDMSANEDGPRAFQGSDSLTMPSEALPPSEQLAEKCASGRMTKPSAASMRRLLVVNAFWFFPLGRFLLFAGGGAALLE